MIVVFIFLSTFACMLLLSKLGRRTTLLNASIMMTLDLILIGVFTTFYKVPSAVITLVLLFILVYGSSIGTIMWLYNSEIMQSRAVSLATTLGSLVNMVFSYFIPIVIEKLGSENIGFIFLTMGIMTFCSTVFISVYVKETRGKS